MVLALGSCLFYGWPTGLKPPPGDPKFGFEGCVSCEKAAKLWKRYTAVSWNMSCVVTAMSVGNTLGFNYVGGAKWFQRKDGKEAQHPVRVGFIFDFRVGQKLYSRPHFYG